MPNSLAKRQAGFTLIELLIAMMIAAVIAVMAYQAISQVVGVKTHTDESGAQFDALQKAIWWLEQDLVQLAPRTVLDELGDVLPAMWVQADLVAEWSRFAAYPTPYGQAGLLRVGYVLEGESLYRLVWPVMDRAQDTQPKKIKLLSNVETFELRLLNAENQWQSLWPAMDAPKAGLPKMIELTLSLKGMGQVRRLLTGVDAPIVEAPAGN